jgi:hypothetical protein
VCATVTFRIPILSFGLSLEIALQGISFRAPALLVLHQGAKLIKILVPHYWPVAGILKNDLQNHPASS